MKKILLLTMLLAMISVPAFALPMALTDVTLFTATGTTPVEDYDSHRFGDVNFMVEPINNIGDCVEWTHHLDFVPPLSEISSATLTLALVDDEVNDGIETGYLLTESGFWTDWDVATDEYSFNIDVAFLTDGEFKVLLSSLKGDFYVNSSTLTINYESTNQAAPVPEPATVLLMGVGLAGIAAIQRKRIKNDKKND